MKTHAFILTIVAACIAASASAYAEPGKSKAGKDGDEQSSSFAVTDGSNRLKLGTRFILEPNIKNVRDAINYVIRPAGYKLIANHPGLITLNTLASAPLPPMAQVAGNMSIERALLILIGDKNRLVVDHKRRLIGVEPLTVPLAKNDKKEGKE